MIMYVPPVFHNHFEFFNDNIMNLKCFFLSLLFASSGELHWVERRQVAVTLKKFIVGYVYTISSK